MASTIIVATSAGTGTTSYLDVDSVASGLQGKLLKIFFGTLLEMH